MLWTVIGYQVDLGLSEQKKDDQNFRIKETPFIKTFYGPHDGQKAIQEASKRFNKPQEGVYVTVVSVVAGNHETSTYIK